MLRVRLDKSVPQDGKRWRVYRDQIIPGFQVPKTTVLAAFYDWPAAIRYARKTANLWERGRWARHGHA